MIITKYLMLQWTVKDYGFVFQTWTQLSVSRPSPGSQGTQR